MLSIKQEEFLRNCNHRWNVKTGATRSGKTHLDLFAVIPKRIMACRGEGLIVLLGNTKGTLQRNILDPMRDMWGHRQQFVLYRERHQTRPWLKESWHLKA